MTSSKSQSKTESLISTDTPISAIQPIETSRNTVPLSRDMLAELVEIPMLDACQNLWDKGILTLGSSANYKDLESGFVYLTIDWDSLSDHNKAIAIANATTVFNSEDPDPYLTGHTVKERVIWVDPRPKYDGRGTVTIAIPVDNTTTVADIKKDMVEITDKFVMQSANWVREYSITELIRLLGIPQDYEVSIEDLIDSGFYYDEETEMFFQSEDLFRLKKRR